MAFTEELNTNILLIIDSYEDTFNDAPTLEELIENDLEFLKLSQHLLVMHGYSHYNGYTIVEQNTDVYKDWIMETAQSRFKREVRSFWRNNPKLLISTKNLATGTALLTNLLGDVTPEQLRLLHEIFFGIEKPLRF